MIAAITINKLKAGSGPYYQVLAEDKGVTTDLLVTIGLLTATALLVTSGLLTIGRTGVLFVAEPLADRVLQSAIPATFSDFTKGELASAQAVQSEPTETFS